MAVEGWLDWFGVLRSSFTTRGLNPTVETKQFHLVEATDICIEELIDDAILELCFEIHREAKLGSRLVGEFTAIPNKSTGTSGRSVKTAVESVFCHICRCNKGPNNFTNHLYHCMTVLKGDEGTSRKARTKMINFKEWDSADEGDDVSTSNKKAKRSKKATRGKSKSSGSTLSKPSFSVLSNSLDEWSVDEKKAFFDQRCRVVSKRARKLCMNSFNYAIHNDAEQKSVRHNHLREMDDEQDNGQIDVDTIDEESNIMLPYNDGSISTIPD